MNEAVSHEGIVERVENGKIFVRISSQSACSMCHSKSMCSVAEIADKLIETPLPPTAGISPGQRVNVVLDRRLGNKAIVLGYALPFVIMLITLAGFSTFTSELYAGAAALISLAVYYVLLFFFRNKLARQYDFRIEKI